jgi:SNF2 family DNA or RNA helicase
MYKAIRKKVAKSVSTIDRAEDFEWRKWLKDPQLSLHEIDPFTTNLIDAKPLNTWLVSQSTETSKIKGISLFAADVYPESKAIHPKKTKTNPVFFGLGTTKVERVKLNVSDSNLFKKKPAEIDFKKSPVQVNSFSPKFKDLKQENVEWQINPPEITEKLSALKPKVFNLELLNPGSFDSAAFASKHQSINVDILRALPRIFKVKILGLDKIKLGKIYFLKNVTLSESKLDKKTFNQINKSVRITGKTFGFEKAKQIKIFSENDESEKKKLFKNEPIPDISVIETVKASLEPVEEIRVREKHENIFHSLYSYQEEGAEFLINNNYALLADELGLGKTIQAISALKNLFRTKDIKSAVIICRKYDIGDHKVTDSTGYVDGWVGHLQKWAPELSLSIVKGTPQERSAIWKKKTLIHVVSYDSFFFDIGEDIIDASKLKATHCFVFDEAQDIFKKVLDSSKFLKSINPKFIWALSSLPVENVKADLNSVLIQKYPVNISLSRSRKEISGQIPKVIWQENWLPFDEAQKTEYNDALHSAKEKVHWLLETGNPLRFQANIFTILHQLKQVCNFATTKETSPKTELLVKHVDTIAQNKKKVIIFSQYDKMGTKKLEELLKKQGVQYRTYQPGMSTKEMETAVNSFINNKNVVALIAGVKASRIRINSEEVPYVVHFDQWWNPAFLWQTEESISLPPGSTGNKQSLSVYSYLIKDSIEEKIQNLLYRKGLLEKNIMDSIPAESIAELISNEEWLEVFDMPDQNFKKNNELKLISSIKKIESINTKEMIEKVRAFLMKIGCRNIEMEEENSDTLVLSGKYRKGDSEIPLFTKCFVQEKVDSEPIRDFAVNTKEKIKGGKIFIISSGSFVTDENLKLDENVSLLDGRLFANYLHHFNLI